MTINETIEWLRCGDDKANAAADAIERELPGHRVRGRLKVEAVKAALLDRAEILNARYGPECKAISTEALAEDFAITACVAIDKM